MNGEHEAETRERLINLGHLSSGVGHHVINAFSAIVSNAELLRLKPPVTMVTDPVALAETIIKSALEASTVARQLIDHSRIATSIESEHDPRCSSLVALDGLVAETAGMEQAKCGRNIVWGMNIEPIPPIRGSEFQLRAMLIRLLENAYESMRAGAGGGEIWISTSTDSRGWNALEIRDTGEGMEASVLERAVEPFFSTRPGHLGVGLSIANGIWRRHKGTLSIQSHPGEGTRVRLCVEPAAR